MILLAPPADKFPMLSDFVISIVLLHFRNTEKQDENFK